LLAVKGKPPRGASRPLTAPRNAGLLLTMSFWRPKRPLGRAAHQKDMDAKRRADETRSPEGP